jgi:hypothetical protein
MCKNFFVLFPGIQIVKRDTIKHAFPSILYLLRSPGSTMKSPYEFPIDGVLDLHTFLPGETKDLVPEYLMECRQRGILQVRIIHGKGAGALRRTVRSILEQLAYVESFRTAEESGGGWGATIVQLKK